MNKENEQSHYAITDAYKKLIKEGLEDYQTIQPLVDVFGAKEVSEWLEKRKHD